MPLNWEDNRLDWEDNQLDWEDNLQALQNRIWDLGLNSKNPYKGKIQAFGAKLGLFWDHFWTFLGLCRYFHEMEKTCKKPRSRDISQFKIYLTVSRYQRAREYQRHAHDTLCMSK